MSNFFTDFWLEVFEQCREFEPILLSYCSKNAPSFAPRVKRLVSKVTHELTPLRKMYKLLQYRWKDPENVSGLCGSFAAFADFWELTGPVVTTKRKAKYSLSSTFFEKKSKK